MKVSVKLTKSPIGYQSNQKACLIGLGLKKLNEERELELTPQIQGMLRKVAHLVQIREI